MMARDAQAKQKKIELEEIEEEEVFEWPPEPAEVQKVILGSKGDLSISFSDEIVFPQNVLDIYEED